MPPLLRFFFCSPFLLYQEHKTFTPRVHRPGGLWGAWPGLRARRSTFFCRTRSFPHHQRATGSGSRMQQGMWWRNSGMQTRPLGAFSRPIITVSFQTLPPVDRRRVPLHSHAGQVLHCRGSLRPGRVGPLLQYPWPVHGNHKPEIEKAFDLNSQV